MVLVFASEPLLRKLPGKSPNLGNAKEKSFSYELLLKVEGNGGD